MVTSQALLALWVVIVNQFMDTRGRLAGPSVSYGVNPGEDAGVNLMVKVQC